MRHVLISALLLIAVPAFATPKPPGFATIQRLCAKTQKLRGAKAHSKGVPTGAGRFLSIVHYRHSKGAAFSLALLQLQQRAGQWVISGRWPLQMKSKIRGGNPYSPASLCPEDSTEWKPASALFVKDYDGDGKLEALVRLKFCWMIPAIGATSVRTMQLFNITAKGIADKPSLAIEIEHDARPTTMGRKLGRYKFEDLDGDGHADLRLRVTSTYATFIKDVEHECMERWVRRFYWKKAGDRYVEVARRKKRAKRRCKKME